MLERLSNILCLTIVFALCGCATVLDEDGALAIAAYKIEDNGRIVVEARVNGKGPYAFALDTAASISAVFDKLRDELDLEAVPGKSVLVHGVVASGQYPLLRIGRLDVGNETWNDPRIVSLPGNTAIDASIDGILGVDFLRRYAVGFSTRDRIVRLYPPDLVGRRSYRGWASVPLEPEYIGVSGAAIYFIDTEIAGRKLPAVFDLGAGLNLINPAAAERLGLNPTNSRNEDLVSGAIETTPILAWVRVPEMTTGRIRWSNEVFSIAEFEIFTTLMRGDTPCAILGAGLFHQRDFIIDFARSRLLVKVAMDEIDAFDLASTTAPDPSQPQIALPIACATPHIAERPSHQVPRHAPPSPRPLGRLHY